MVYLLALFGPWPWPFPNVLKLTFTVFCYSMALIFGYILALNLYKVKKNSIKINFSGNYIMVTSIMFLILSLIVFNYRTNIFIFNIPQLYTKILVAINNPSYLYYEKLVSYDSGTSLYALMVNILFSIMYYLVLAILIFNWKRVSLKIKVIIFWGIIINLLSWFLIGTNKGFFDIAIIGIIYFLYKVSNIVKSDFLNIKFYFSGLFPIVLLILALYYFNLSTESRIGQVTYSTSTGLSINQNSILYNITPDFLKNLLVMISSYLTQGYYGLSLAMEEDFNSTLFIGSSTFLSNFFENYLGISYFNNYSYPAKIEYLGWDKYVNWHTAYTWFASDVSFYGVPLIMMLFGFLLCVFWKEGLTGNVNSMVLFVIIMMLIFYIPANNQIFSFPGTFITFYFFLLCRIFNGRLKIN